MAEEEEEEEEEQSASPTTSTSSSSSMLIIRLMSKRRTWACLFIVVYTVLLSSSWNILKSILSWYETTTSSSSALYASVALGALFGLLSMAAALAVALPATMVTWVTVLVLLAFCGKPRTALVDEGKKLTFEIVGFVVKILIKEGNVVAAICAVLVYVALFRRNRDDVV
ncbi:unnamed protein product [Camellia sinensis]